MRRRAVSALGHFGRSYGSASTKGRWAHEHVIVAERAFGKALPKGAEVHHVDEDKFNNHRSNLVICQDRAYHQLLHQRARIVRAGGTPNTQRVRSVRAERHRILRALNPRRLPKQVPRVPKYYEADRLIHLPDEWEKTAA
jgi:hypothetical protein